MTLPYDRNKGIITYALLLYTYHYFPLLSTNRGNRILFVRRIAVTLFFKQKIFLFLRFENAAQQAQIESASI